MAAFEMLVLICKVLITSSLMMTR